MFHFFLFLPQNLPKMTYIEVLKSLQNDNICTFWQVRRGAPKLFLGKLPKNLTKMTFRRHFRLLLWSQKISPKRQIVGKNISVKISPKWHFRGFHSRCPFVLQKQSDKIYWRFSNSPYKIYLMFSSIKFLRLFLHNFLKIYKTKP